MDMKYWALALLTALALTAGCGKSETPGAPPRSPSGQEIAPLPRPPVLARIHWLGKKRIAADTNSAVLMPIWNEPESAKLEAQILDKFSLTPWQFLGQTVDTNAGAILRPLLNDIVENECYLEIRQGL